MDPILVDLYAGDYNGKPPIAQCAAWGACCGILLKATQGLYYDPAGWFDPAWKAVRTARGTTSPVAYGTTWFRGAYLFLDFKQMGALQADKYLAAIARAGGWGPGDLPPVIDIELGNPGTKDKVTGHVYGRNPNQDATPAQIVDCVSSCADRLRDETGRPIIAYGIGAMRDREITSRMGCSTIIVPNYGDELAQKEYEACGWDVASLLGWQYSGNPDGGRLKGYPTVIPGTVGNADLTAIQQDLQALCAMRIPDAV